MAATTITRSTWTDGASGTILDNAALGTDIYDRIDALFTSAFTFGDLVHAEGAGTHTWYGGTTGAQIFNLQNTTAGTAARTIVRLGNDASVNCANFAMHSTSYTTSGPNIQDGALLACSRAGGVTVAATNASGSVQFYAAGTTKNATYDGDTVDLASAAAGAHALSGVLDDSVNTTSTGTDADTAEKTLHSFSLPASTLATDGQSVRITAAVTTAANSNTKTIRIKFGATAIVEPTGSLNDAKIILEAWVIRTGAATQVVAGGIVSNAQASGAPTGGTSTGVTTAAETLSGAVTIAITGQNGTASASDIVCKWSQVEFLP